MSRASHDSLLLFDHGGHNFTCELARDLAAQGTRIVYAYTEGVTAPHGRVESSPELRIEALGRGRVFERYRLRSRVVAEIRLGFEAARLAHRSSSGHVITCNMPVIIVAILAAFCRLTGRRFTVWFQDSQAGIAAAMVQSGFALRLVGWVEGWGLRRANRVIAISPAMVREAERMGVKPDRIALLPNWAPISQIPVMDKVNPWSIREGLSETFVFLYSGTLGLKHSPDRLLALARWIQADKLDAVVLVVSEGPTAEGIRTTGETEGLPIIVRPYQSAEELPQVLATADVCIVLLEPRASEFSVPSKVWSYMCAGRPILGAAPGCNEATIIVTQQAKCGIVIEPGDEQGFRVAATALFDDEVLRSGFATASRSFASANFSAPSALIAFVRAALPNQP